MITFTLLFVAVLGMKALAAFMRRLETRDQEKANLEGYKAYQAGPLPVANPYLEERSDRFRRMALAWSQGYVRADTEQRDLGSGD